MSVLFLVLILIINLISFEFYNPTKKQLLFSGVTSVTISHILYFSGLNIMTLEVLVLFLFFYSFIHRNPITNILIYNKMIIYYLLSLTIICLIRIFIAVPIDVIYSYYLYPILLSSLFLLDYKFSFTNAFIIKSIQYLELITVFFALLTVILISFFILISDVSKFEAIIIVLTNLAVIIMFTGDSLAFSYYIEKCSFVHNLNKSLFEEYHTLVSEHYKNLNSFNTLVETDSSYDLVKRYFNNHKVPIYSNNQKLNFMLYYILKKQDDNTTFIHTDYLENYSEEINFILFFISELLDSIPEVTGYAFTTSILESNSILISVSGVSGLNNKIQQIFSGFSLKKEKNSNNFFLNHLNCKSLEYLLKKYRISSSIFFDNNTIIKISL